MLDTKQQKSKIFLLPKFELSKELVDKVNTYCGISTSDSLDAGLYLHLKDEDSNIDLELELINNQYYANKIEVSDGYLYKLVYPRSFKSKVVQPFLRGEYSKIDKEYVKKHFIKYVRRGNEFELSTPYRIFYKSEILRNYWENRLDVTLPEDAEVYSRPEKEDETFNIHITQNII